MKVYHKNKSLIKQSDNYEYRRDIIQSIYLLSHPFLLFYFHPNVFYKFLTLVYFISLITLIIHKTFFRVYLKVEQYYQMKRDILLYEYNNGNVYNINKDITNIIKKYLNPIDDIYELHKAEYKVKMREYYGINF